MNYDTRPNPGDPGFEYYVSFTHEEEDNRPAVARVRKRQKQETQRHARECRRKNPAFWRKLRKLTFWELLALAEKLQDIPLTAELADMQRAVICAICLRDTVELSPQPALPEPEQPIQRYRRKRPASVATSEPTPSYPPDHANAPATLAGAEREPVKALNPPRRRPEREQQTNVVPFRCYGKVFGVRSRPRNLNAEMRDPRSGGYGR